MARKFLLFLVILTAVTTQAQNLQLHFDPRHSLYGDDFNRNYLTATFEMFKPDKWGSTFMFVDADFNISKGNIGLMYTEIARDFRINNFPLMPHVEFNGGLGLYEVEGVTGGYSIPNSYMVGVSYPFQLGNFFMSTYLVYKLNAFKVSSHDVQWTLIWNANFVHKKISLSGFLDLWTENKNATTPDDGKKVILLSEPQFWYNVTDHFSLGSEVEISSNFAGATKAYVCPTIAAKWIF